MPERGNGTEQRNEALERGLAQLRKATELAVGYQPQLVTRAEASAVLDHIERLRDALRDEIAMSEQTEKTLRNLHDNWRDIVDESDPDGGPLIENILYWLIEDVGQDDARKALRG